MSWHNYSIGEKVSLGNIISTVEKRIKSGKVKDIDGKKKLLRQISDCGHSYLIYTPIGAGWGNTPLNPNNWRTLNGGNIFKSK